MKRKVAIILVLVLLLSQFALSVSAALSNPFSGYYNGFRYEGSLTGTYASVTTKLYYAADLENIKTVGSAREESTTNGAYYNPSLSTVGKGNIQKTATARNGFVIATGWTTCTYYANDIYTNTYHSFGTLTK